MQVYLISKFIKASYMYHAGAARSRNYIDEASAKFLKRILCTSASTETKQWLL